MRVARSELDAWDADPRHDWRGLKIFDSSDGVRIVALLGTYSPHVAKAQDGKLWFTTSEGLSVVDPQHLPHNQVPPPVRIETVKVNGKEQAAGEGLKLSHSSNDLEIDYTALSFTNPDRVYFRYKLEGKDADWQDVGTRRQAYYGGLAPRNYRFLVMACNNDGVWNEAGAAWSFTIVPAFYQTWWFQALSGMAFLAVLWGLYQLRVLQIAREYNMRLEERVGERTRIARDLHDTLLQSFQGLMLHLQAVNFLLPEGKAKEKLEQTLERADQAMAEGRSTVYDLRSSAKTAEDLAQAVRAVGEELATPDSAAFRLVVEGPPRDLNPIIRDELYCIAREGLRNAYRHARADQIETEISYSERAFRLRIRDDGEGIPPEILEKGRAGHYGLGGMHERAKQIGAKLDIWSGAKAGTEIELTVAGSIAYGSRAGRPFLHLFKKKTG